MRNDHPEIRTMVGGRSDLRHYIVSVGAQAVGRVASLAANMVSLAMVARALPPVSFGEYVLTLALVATLAQVADFGTTAIIGKELPHYRSSPGPFWTSFLLMRSALSLPAMAITVAASFFLSDSAGQALLIGAFAVPLLAARFFDPVYQVFGRAWYSAVALIAYALVSIAGNGAVFILAPSLKAFLLAVVAANLAYVVVALWLAFRLIIPSPKPGHVHLRKMLRLAAPIGLAALLTSINGRANLLFLDHFRGPEDVGIFGAAGRLLEAGMSLAIMALSPLIPTFSRLSADPIQLAARSRQTLLVLTSISLPVLIVAPYLSDPIVTLLYGSRYQGSAHALALLSWVGALACFAVLCSYVLLALGITRFALWNTGCVVVVNLSLNLTLIPGLGPDGAAWAQIGSEIVMVLTTAFQLHRALPGALPLREGILPVLAAIIAAGTINVGFDQLGPLLLGFALLPCVAVMGRFRWEARPAG
ncbi:MAG: hypothetical protein JWM91_332 [Rhodospirillales bacterium]|nr:hypothetical protein [Rhodospirillales bacterium]